MFGLKKSPLHRFSKHNSADPGFPVNNRANPFDSDDESDNKQTLKSSGRTSSHELDNKQTLKSSGRTSSEPSLFTSDLSTNPFDDVEIKGTSSSQNYLSSAAKNKYKNDFRDSGGLENQTVQELENYSVYKAEETTKTVNHCLKIAEDIREDATKTLVTLHQQGEQITRTHMVAADMDHDLSRGEKLLGSLGGMFSKTWKPKITRPITGPIITRDDPVQRRGNHLEQRERLGLSSSKERSHTRTPPPEPTDALQKVEVEKVKQDDALSDLSRTKLWIMLRTMWRSSISELKVPINVPVVCLENRRANRIRLLFAIGLELSIIHPVTFYHLCRDVSMHTYKPKFDILYIHPRFLDINPELLPDVLFLLSGIGCCFLHLLTRTYS
ncbi:UNVERIFIED_CONTAM: SNAP25 homologous protein SNAP33 [Sesamum latifolium]|uniref:SNAP25 homologous protein SNAP33 n=1 Tax=Sesamum latifolium TaxID=2727402 RepID=A0AAW2UHM5_9LAMI